MIVFRLFGGWLLACLIGGVLSAISPLPIITTLCSFLRCCMALLATFALTPRQFNRSFFPLNNQPSMSPISNPRVAPSHTPSLNNLLARF